MKNKSKIELKDLSNKVKQSEIKPLSDAETTQIVGGKNNKVRCPGFPYPFPGGPYW